jgi:hypothetical protein
LFLIANSFANQCIMFAVNVTLSIKQGRHGRRLGNLWYNERLQRRWRKFSCAALSWRMLWRLAIVSGEGLCSSPPIVCNSASCPRLPYYLVSVGLMREKNWRPTRMKARNSSRNSSPTRPNSNTTKSEPWRHYAQVRTPIPVSGLKLSVN